MKTTGRAAFFWLKKYLIFFIVNTLVLGIESYKFLCVFPVPSRSHGIMGKGIVDSLLEAGHQVSWVTPFTDWQPKQNLTLITVPENVALATEVKMSERSAEGISFILGFGKNISTMTIQNERVRDALVKQQFDAVVTEWFMTESDAGYAAIQQVPWILFSGVAMHPHMEFLVDEVRSVSTLPLFLNDGPIPMNFWARLLNTATLVWMFFWALPETDAVSDRYYSFFTPLAEARGMQLPPFIPAVFNISILLVNSHPSITPAQALPPNVIEVGGFHMQEEVDPLPKDLQDIMDGSPQGVVYFSMGSVFKAADMPAKTALDIVSILGELPHTVLWKYEAPMQGLPPNVHIRPWFPQASVLAHPNTLLFITHGGQLSLLEAVRHGVPVLALPVFADQPANAARAVRLGLGRSVPWSTRAVGELRRQLHHMLGDRSYLQRAQQLALEFNSRPLPPRRLLTHYLELAIQTKGALHLRSVSRLYPWWSRWMLDQLLAAVLLLATIKCVLTLLWNTATTWRQNNIKTKKTKTS